MYKFPADLRMPSGRTSIGKFLVPALALLLLCGIVAAEVPELLSLTDNAANDFAVRKTNPLPLSSRLNASRLVAIVDSGFISSGAHVLFSRLSPFDRALLIPVEPFLLHSVLRT